MTRSIYQEALDVQDASNLSGVVHSFSRVMTAIWEEYNSTNGSMGTPNHHPVSVLFADKIAHLTGTQDLGSDVVSKAYSKVYGMIERIEKDNAKKATTEASTTEVPS